GPPRRVRDPRRRFSGDHTSPDVFSSEAACASYQHDLQGERPGVRRRHRDAVRREDVSEHAQRPVPAVRRAQPGEEPPTSSGATEHPEPTNSRLIRRKGEDPPLSNITDVLNGLSSASLWQEGVYKDLK